MNKIDYKLIKQFSFSYPIRILATLALFLLGEYSVIAAVPALFLEQSRIGGASDTLKASRVPVRNSAGVIKY
jgi:hypothetical protein